MMLMMMVGGIVGSSGSHRNMVGGAFRSIVEFAVVCGRVVCEKKNVVIRVGLN